MGWVGGGVEGALQEGPGILGLRKTPQTLKSANNARPLSITNWPAAPPPPPPG